MRFKVTIFNDSGEIISNDIWHGTSVDNIKFWVDLAIKEIIKNADYQHLYYNVEES